MLSSIMQTLGVAEPERYAAQHWDASLRSLPAGDIDWLREDFIREAGGYVGLTPQTIGALLAEAPRIVGEPQARALAWHAHRLAYVHDGGFGMLPDLRPLLGRDPGLFAMLVMLAGYPRMRKVHEAHGIPDDAVRAILKDVPPRVERYLEKRGVPGLCIVHAGGWFPIHFRGELYRIGRLQYVLRPCGETFTMFRHRATGRVVAIAGDRQTYRADGYANHAGGVADQQAWRPTLQVDEQSARGHRIDPSTGRIERQVVTLPRAEWTLAMKPEDLLLEIHIPRGGPMDFDACGRSHREAITFFDRHFPQRRARGVVCTSWIMDPQLADYLSPQSNMVRHLAEYYLLTVPGNPESAARFVFHLDPDETFDPAVQPRETSLQRAILDHLQGGHHWRNTRGVILREDLDWGAQVYRRGFDPAYREG